MRRRVARAVQQNRTVRVRIQKKLRFPYQYILQYLNFAFSYNSNIWRTANRPPQLPEVTDAFCAVFAQKVTVVGGQIAGACYEISRLPALPQNLKILF